MVGAQNLEVMWILFAQLAAYISKFRALAPTCLGFFFRTQCLQDPLQVRASPFKSEILWYYYMYSAEGRASKY